MDGLFNNNFWSMILSILSGNPNATGKYISQQSRDSAISKLYNGEISAEDFLGQTAKNGWTLSPEQETYLQSLLSNQRTNEARDYETMMANSDLLRAGEQLNALGLSPANVLQTGGSAVPNVSAASTPAIQNANQRYDRMSSLANSLIGMAGRMASSGIYGKSLAGVREAAARQAAMAAHSATEIRQYDENGKFKGKSFSYNVRGSSEDEVGKYFY